MKRKIKYITTLLITIILYSCEKPAPTELIVDETSDLEIEVVPQDPENFEYVTGYDTTARVSPLSKVSSEISVGYVKTSYNNLTINSVLAQAIFFDKSKPIKLKNGRTVGFRTRPLGNVYFEDQLARRVPFYAKMKEHGMRRDSLAGIYHLLHKKNNIGDQFNFPFSSKVDFKLQLMNHIAVQLEIPTPEEITGSVETSGSFHSSNFKYILKWNGTNKGNINIIIGGKTDLMQASSPIYKLKTTDDGELIIPAFLIKDFPFNQFKYIVFTIIRQMQFDKQSDNTLKDNFIAAYCIHNIQLDIP